jgi:drug/metabolite transporter (DMT)-like permease
VSTIERRRLAKLTDSLRASGRPGRRNEPVAAFLWVTVAVFLFAGLGAFAKFTANYMPPLEVIFFRNVGCVLFLLPLLWLRGPSIWRSDQLPLYGFRVGLQMVSMTTWFTAVVMIPMAELMAIGFLAPLFGTLFAMLFLHEVVRGRRWVALAVGFAGAMIILRPGGTEMGLGQACALASAVLAGVIGPMVKQLTVRDDADKIVFLTNVMLVPLSLLVALPVWVWPSIDAVPYILGMGLCGVLGHIAHVRAYAASEASLVFTYEFSRLPFAAGIGYVFFGETIDGWTVVGALIIFGSAVYIVRREAQIKREAGMVRARRGEDPLALTPLTMIER